MDFLGGANSYALAVSLGDRHGFNSFPDRKRTDPVAGVHGQCPLRRGRLGRRSNLPGYAEWEIHPVMELQIVQQALHHSFKITLLLVCPGHVALH
jgi:hypothetical protein